VCAEPTELEKLAEANASNKRKVREFLVRYIEDYEDADLRAYLSEVKKATKMKGGLLALRKKWSTLLGSYEIPGAAFAKDGSWHPL
jgi:hypothetical protein